MSNANNHCEVCGAPMGPSLLTCPECGCKLSASTLFADENSLNVWRDQINSYQIKRNLSRSFLFRRHKLMLFPTRLCVCKADDNSMVIYTGDNAHHRLKSVVECSVNTRHAVYLKSDQTIYAEGSNTDGQCDLKDLTGIRGIYAGANCTYAINSQGKVIIRGYSPVAQAVSAWRNIRKIVGNKGRVVGLTKQNTIVIADDIQTASTNAQNVVDVDTTYNFTIWLHKDGTVGCLCKASDPRADAAKWKDIVAVGVENNYAVGLKKDGSVVVAGKTIPGIDMGRSEVAAWTNVVSIVCSNSGIMGVLADGTVEIVGNVENRAAICQQFARDLAEYW